MWMTVSYGAGYGFHKVLVPKGFDKTIEDFGSTGEFLAAIRAAHMQQHNAHH